MSGARLRDTERRAVQLARTFEEHRGSRLVDVSEGRRPETRDFFEQHGRLAPTVASADLLAHAPDDVGGDRLIEVKGRGSSGPITVIERELATFQAAGPLAWLYIVFNTTQAQPAQLWLINDPAQLDWVETLPAQRSPDQPRGVRHEAQFQISSDIVHSAGTLAGLAELGDLPTWCGASRD